MDKENVVYWAGYGGSHLYHQLLGRQRAGGLKFKASPCKKMIKTASQQISCVWWYMPVISVI
jgi:hypothetical protein